MSEGHQRKPDVKAMSRCAFLGTGSVGLATTTLAASFSKMKLGSFLINASRGPLTIDQDLADALDHGRLAGARLWMFFPASRRRESACVSRWPPRQRSRLDTPGISACRGLLPGIGNGGSRRTTESTLSEAEF